MGKYDATTGEAVCEFEASGYLCHLKGLRENCHMLRMFYDRCEVRHAGLLKYDSLAETKIKEDSQ